MYYTQVTQHNTYCIINLSYCPCSPYCPLLPTFERRIERILWYIFVHIREWCAPCVPHTCVCVYWDLSCYFFLHSTSTVPVQLCYVSVSETALAWIDKDRGTRRKGRIEWNSNETKRNKNQSKWNKQHTGPQYSMYNLLSERALTRIFEIVNWYSGNKHSHMHTMYVCMCCGQKRTIIYIRQHTTINDGANNNNISNAIWAERVLILCRYLCQTNGHDWCA